jgi:glyoxylase-like metal-dependent hydrolase (beta-lactamase superfamily II)
MTPLKLGKFALYPLLDGYFHLDGGSMFGIVPKNLWQRIYKPDAQNRIRLAARSLLVEANGKWILIDTGIGNKFDDKKNQIYGIEKFPGIIAQLKEIGITELEISVVINSHLHWDHAGGNTIRHGNDWIPAFPNARYVIQRGEFDFATHLNERTRGSYRIEDYVALEKLGYFDFVDGDSMIVPGVQVVRSGGHVPYHQCVSLHSDSKKAFFLGDLLPTHGHLSYPYIMAFDLNPLETLEKKKEYLEQAMQEDWLLFFVHDPDHPCGKIVKTESGIEFRALERGL